MASLAQASLTPTERRVLDRFVGLLRQELGEDLRAVWLYGSRARGEPPRDEDSDVDIFVVISGQSSRHKDRVQDHVRELARSAEEAESRGPFSFSVLVDDDEWIADRREIESFFIQEMDRDKIVLWGDGEVAAEASRHTRPRASPHGMRPRSEEFISLAREQLEVAELTRAAGHPLGAAPEAYFAMLYAARAALSEEDHYSRTHIGTWYLFRELLVNTGRFDAALAKQAEEGQKVREGAHYKAVRPTSEQAEALVEAAQRFLDAVLALYR